MPSIISDPNKKRKKSSLKESFRTSKERYEGKVKRRYDAQGRGGVWELAEKLTDKFEKLNEDREWNGEYFDELEDFLTEELK